MSVRLAKIDKGFPVTIGKGESKYDINEAIRQVIDAYAVNNLQNALSGRG